MASRRTKAKLWALIAIAGAMIAGAIVAKLLPNQQRAADPKLDEGLVASRVSAAGMDSIARAEALERLAGSAPDSAESALQQAIAIRDRLALPKDRVLWADLDRLARLYVSQEKYAEAESPARRSFELAQEIFGKSDPQVARCLML